MRLTSIEMTNWKCFNHRKIDFDKVTFLNWKNGEGKTSLIQAIILCLFDKRPDNLNFESLVDTSKESKIILKFTYNAATYVIEREVGKTSGYRVFKNEELISRTSAESKKILKSIISESILTSLWGYEPLSVSNVLNTNYLYDILGDEFQEPLNIKQYFLSDRSYHQKRTSTLEKQITNQELTQSDIDKLKNELDTIEAKIKEKAFISDNEVIKAKKAKEDFKVYEELISQLEDSVPYDRELCLRLKDLASSPTEWEQNKKKLEEELKAEKSKASASPIIKYPKNVVASMIKESEGGKCILCGNPFHMPELNYDTIDYDKIQRLEKVLEDYNTYNFAELKVSIKYWHIKKHLAMVDYVKDYDFQTILDNYDKDTNDLYKVYEEKKSIYESSNTELANIQEYLESKRLYAQDKQCIELVEQYIAEAKDYYANSIASTAAKTLHEINTRYTTLFIEKGIYKVTLWDKDFEKQSTLPVHALSKGEKTIVALSLILAIRDLFMKDLPLIMDESFANLDADNLEAIKKLIQTDENQWIIVSHDERLIM